MRTPNRNQIVYILLSRLYEQIVWTLLFDAIVINLFDKMFSREN